MPGSPARKSFAPSKWNQGFRLEPHGADAYGTYFPSGGRPRPEGDTEARLQMRIGSAELRNLAPRDPRWHDPKREAGWDNRSPLWERYIPSYGYADESTCIGQQEDWVKRPTLGAGGLSPVSRTKREADNTPTTFVQARARSGFGRRTTPLISYDSIGWNRRNFEPIPDASRPSSRMGSESSWMWHREEDEPVRRPKSRASSRAMSRDASRERLLRDEHGAASEVAPPSPGGSEALEALYAASEGSAGPVQLDEYREAYHQRLHAGTALSPYDPPRLAGVDTTQRPPLVVHMPSKIVRPPWIGVRY